MGCGDCHADHYSIYQISKALRLNYSALKNRIQEKISSQLPSNYNSPPNFVEIPILQTVTPSESTVEMLKSKSDGTCMKINIKGQAEIELSETVRNFWNCVS